MLFSSKTEAPPSCLSWDNDKTALLNILDLNSSCIGTKWTNNTNKGSDPKRSCSIELLIRHKLQISWELSNKVKSVQFLQEGTNFKGRGFRAITTVNKHVYRPTT